jgi:predicted nucleic acid-binding Zn ribbon protein
MNKNEYVNWNAHQTFEPWRTCPVCGKEFRQDEPGCCSTRCEEKMEASRES